MYDISDKKKNQGNDMKKEAKLTVLKEMRKMASDMMGNDLKNGMDMKKVTVAAPTKEGLQHGLGAAEEVLEGHPDEMDSADEEDAESMDDMENCSDQELEDKIRMLQEIQAKRK